MIIETDDSEDLHTLQMRVDGVFEKFEFGWDDEIGKLVIRHINPGDDQDKRTIWTSAD